MIKSILIAGAVLLFAFPAYASGGPPEPRYHAPSYIDPEYKPPKFSEMAYNRNDRFAVIMQTYRPAPPAATAPPDEQNEQAKALSALLESKGLAKEGGDFFSPTAWQSRRYEFYACPGNNYTASYAFLQAAFADPKVKGNGYAALAKIRGLVLSVCGATGNAQGLLGQIAALRQSGTAPGYDDYLQAIVHFYSGDTTAALANFSALKKAYAVSGRLEKFFDKAENEGWLAQTASYMTARTLLVRAQGEWDGYTMPPTVDHELLLQAATAYQDYLRLYPQGLYAESATNIMRKIWFLSGDQAKLDEALRLRANAAFADPKNCGCAEMDEFGRFFKGRVDIALDFPLLVAWEWMGDKQYTRDDIASLEQQEKRFADFPGLFDFLHAWGLYKMGAYQQALDKMPPAGENSKNAVERSTEILRAQALTGLGQYDAALQVLRAQNKTGAEDRTTLRIAAIMLKTGQGTAMFMPDSGIDSENILRDLAQFVFDQPALESMLQNGKTLTAPNSLILTEELMRRYLLSGQFAKMAALYKSVPDAGLFTPLRQAVMILSRHPNDDRSRLDIAEFVDDRYLTPSGFIKVNHLWESTGLEELKEFCPDCQSPDQRGTGFIPPFAYFSAVAVEHRASGKKDEFDAEALYHLVRCFRGGSFQVDCKWDHKYPNDSEMWFHRLHRVYKNSPWTAKTPYYYQDQ